MIVVKIIVIYRLDDDFAVGLPGQHLSIIAFLKKGMSNMRRNSFVAILICLAFVLVTTLSCTLSPPFNLSHRINLFSGGGASDNFLVLDYPLINTNDVDSRVQGVSVDHFIEQLSWLKSQGFNFVKFQDIISAQSEGAKLPDKPVLLTIDIIDKNFSSHVLPILRENHISIIGPIDDRREGDGPQFEDLCVSDIVECAQQPVALYELVVANPQGDKEPAATSHLYNTQSKQYETEGHYIDRLSSALESSKQHFIHITHIPPRVIFWPYGAYNDRLIELAKIHKLAASFSLDGGYASLHNLSVIPRNLIQGDPDITAFSEQIRNIGKSLPIRMIQVDLDYVYDENQEQMQRNLASLLNRVHDLKINTVFLQAFADPKGTGLASETYFQNSILPVRSDIFNHVAWLLHQEQSVNVYAWLPVLSFNVDSKAARVQAWDPVTQKMRQDSKAYQRISLFDPIGRHLIESIYEDLSRYCSIQGVLFHDDAILSDYEDGSPPALKAYQDTGLPNSIEQIRSVQSLMDRWTIFKTKAMVDFTLDLSKKLRLYHEPILTARNIYASLLSNPNSEEWFSQNYRDFLAAYNYTAVEAMPYMENIDPSEADDWLTTLADIANSTDQDAMSKTVFELQSVDWRKESASDERIISTKTLIHYMQLLLDAGAVNFGYYPDDFIRNNPNIDALSRFMRSRDSE